MGVLRDTHQNNIVDISYIFTYVSQVHREVRCLVHRFESYLENFALWVVVDNLSHPYKELTEVLFQEKLRLRI